MRRARAAATVIALACVPMASMLAAAGCTATIEEGGGPESPRSANARTPSGEIQGTGTPADQPAPGSAAGGAPGAALQPGMAVPPTVIAPTSPWKGDKAGPYVARRLSNEELVFSVADLLALSPDDALMKSFATDLPGELPDEYGFRFATSFGATDGTRLSGKAEWLSDRLRVRGEAGAGPVVLDCDLAKKSEVACVEALLAGFGRRAFRRPLEAAEAMSLTALFQRVRALDGASFGDGVRAVTSALLQAPPFLFHLPTALPGRERRDRRVALGGYALAERLSYFLWRSLPDEPLLVAAANQGLANPAQLTAQVERMLKDSRARRGVVSLVDQMLGGQELSQLARGTDAKSFPVAELEQELALFAESLLPNPGAPTVPWSSIFSGTTTFANEILARHYGVSVIKGAEFRAMPLPAERTGLLGSGALLATAATATEGSPIKRGKLVRQAFLCQVIPAPPQDLNIPELKQSGKAAKSEREKYPLHQQSGSACAACHARLDTVGFAFLPFDQVGRFRQRDSLGAAIDSSGEVTAIDGRDVGFANLRGLGKILAESAEVRRCAVRTWASFALGRPVLMDEEGSSLEQADRAFEATGQDLRALVAALVSSTAFGWRSLQTGEL